MSGPLDGIRVVELCIMAAGPATTMFLAELGAEVIKIEPPAGDGTRWAHPTQRGMGTNFIAMNVGKNDATCDLKDPAALAAILDVIRDSDVFVQNLRGGVAARLGVGPDDLLAINPELIYCSINGFGSIGPLSSERCSDTIMQAFSGFARTNGSESGDLEQFRFTGLLDLVSASLAAQSIVAALVHRQSTGRGQHVDVSMLGAAMEIQHTRLGEYLLTGRSPHPLGSDSSLFAPDGAFAALDKEVFLTVRDDREWQAFCAIMKRADLATDERFASNAMRVANAPQLRETIEPEVKAKPALWWQRSLAREDIAVTIAWDFDQICQNAQVLANEMVAEVDTPWGTATVGGTPWHFSRTAAQVTPPPAPGSYNDQLTAGLPPRRRVGLPGYSGADKAAAPEPVLAGFRVLELTSGIAGAMTALRLQDLGAEVVKLETLAGDWLRRAAPAAPGAGTAATFATLNRGKQSVAFDLDAENADEFVTRLIESADIVIAGPRRSDDSEPTVVDRMRVRSEAGQASTIWIELSDFGSAGREAHRRGSEVVLQAAAGYTGWLGARTAPSVRLGADVAGCATAMFAVTGALSALFARRSGEGRGQVVRLSALNSLLSLATIHIAAQHDPDDYVGQRVGGAFYPRLTGWKTADSPIVFAFGGAVGSAGRPGWQRFISDLDAAWVKDDPLFADDPTGRQTTGHGLRVEQARGTYESVFKEFPAEHLVTLIRGHGGQATVFQDYEELLAHPQIAALGLIQRPQPGAANGQEIFAYPAQFSYAPITLRDGLSELGADTERIRIELGLPALPGDPDARAQR